MGLPTRAISFWRPVGDNTTGQGLLNEVVGMFFLRERFFDSYNTNSLAWRMRTKRFKFLLEWMGQFSRPLKILDVGGTMNFWQSMGLNNPENIRIVLLNLEADPSVQSEVFVSMAGDATHMPQFGDQEFDIVFSNSVIEHVGDDHEQEKMAREIRRVGRAYFVQTPNLYFPMEAHFCYPFFQFMPVYLRAFLLYYFDITGGGIGRTVEGWKTRLSFRRFERKPCESWSRCMERARSIRLLSGRKFRRMFPDSAVYKEKYMGLTKSFILYNPPLRTAVSSP